MYDEGTTVQFRRAGCPFLGRVVRDDPIRERALIRLTSQAGMDPYSLITAWVPYAKITGTSP